MQFKTFSQRIEEIDIDVYRSLDPLKAEPSEGSSFFRDCLTEYRVRYFIHLMRFIILLLRPSFFCIFILLVLEYFW